MAKRIRVAVLMGGISSEREVSLWSGEKVLANLDPEKYEVMGIDVPKELDKLIEFRPDIAFIALHGAGGEDGKIQGYLETLGIKYTGCGVLASAIGMDKMIFRRLMENEGLRMPKLTTRAPCVVKPVNGGSSVGVSIVKNERDLQKAKVMARMYDENCLIEEYIDGVEATCGVLGNSNPRALPVVEIIPENVFFDYEAKYAAGKSQEICPARFDGELTKEIQRLTVEVFKVIGGRGYARVDFMISKNTPYILEINTLPGLTPNSLLPKEAAAEGVSFPELLDKIIGLGLEDREK